MAGARQDGDRVAPLDTTADIETPEHVRFHVRIAGPSRRALAYAMDLLVRGAVFVGIAIIAGLGGVSIDFEEASTGVMLIVAFALEWGYYILFESLWSGQSPGKKMMGLRVVKEGGYPITFVDVVLRNLLRAADWLPAFNVAGLAVMAFDSRFRRLGDLVAGTMVVSEDRSRIGSALRISPPPSPEELEWIPASVRLDGAELDALELYLRRVGALSPARESELAEIVAPMFARRLGIKYTNAERFLAVLYVRAGGGHAVQLMTTQRKTRGFGRRRKATA